MVERILFSDSALGRVGLGAFSGAGLVDRWAAAASEKARKTATGAVLRCIATYFGRLAGRSGCAGAFIREAQDGLAQVNLVAGFQARAALVAVHFAAHAVADDPDAAA